MRILVLCSARRGLRFLERLGELCPDDDISTASFREEPCEPPFLDDIAGYCRRRGAPLFIGKNLDGSLAALRRREFDLLFAVGWRYMVPMDFAGKMRVAAVVFHDSLLPKNRGFSPTVWAMADGEPTLGATMFHMAKEVDAGDIIDRCEVLVGSGEYIGDAMEKIDRAYLSLIERNLGPLKEGRAPCLPQDHSRATYRPRRTHEDDRIRWGKPAEAVRNLIRALSAPYPGAWTKIPDGRELKIWRADIGDGEGEAGRVLSVHEGCVAVGTGTKTLLLREAGFGSAEHRAPAVLLKVGDILGRD